MNSDEKREISVGCMEYLIGEVKRLRKQNELMGAENAVMHKFFDLVDRLGPPHQMSYSEDRLQQAEKEFKESKQKEKAK